MLPLSRPPLHTSTSKHRKSIRKPGVLRAEMMEESESGQNWLKNQVKVVCEREILASLVEFKHHSMAETIQNEKEEKKTKAKAPGLTKKDKKHQTSNLHISVTAASAVCRSGLDLTPVKISAPPRLSLQR